MGAPKPKMALAYVAGPFTADEPWKIEQNIRAAEAVGLKIVESCGDWLVPLIPHAAGRAFVGTKFPSYWYEATMAMLERCDAVILVPGWQKSRVAKREAARAQRLGLPVFSQVPDLVRWSRAR